MNVLENETRRKIVMLLREGELTAGDIRRALGRPGPTVSQHLASLQARGLLECRPQAVFRHYRLNIERTLHAWDAYINAAREENAA